MAVTKRNVIDVLSVILSSLLSYSLVTGENNCKRSTICSCEFNNGSIIDLSSIATKQGPEWFNQTPINKNDHSFYSYNPCHEFTIGNGGCSGVTVCQQQGTNYYPLGDTDQIQFYFNETINRMQIKYKKNDRITNVTLICSDGPPKLTIEGETKPGESSLYLMTLSSKCACPDGCLKSAEEGLSTGSVLIILLFVFSCIYFLGGMLYLKFVRGASGYEMIPHYEFWLDFPLLVRDGVVFVLSGCRAETTYERI